MSENRLNIIKIDEDSSVAQKKTSIPSRSARLKEMQAKFERIWLLNPQKFNPLRNCMQRERLDRTWHLIENQMDLKGLYATDIGCATGVFSRRLRDAGCRVVAVDIAENALKYVRKEDCHSIEIEQGTMPFTRLPDITFDLVICTEVIAELPPEDYRLFFGELARVVKSKGYVVCSTSIDIYSDDGVQRFVDLAQTEFLIISSIVCHHALYLKIKHFFSMPQKFVLAGENRECKHNELEERKELRKGWFKINSSFPLVYVWKFMSYLTNPIVSLLNNSPRILLGLEKICRFFSPVSGISQVIFIAQRRPLEIPKPKEMPITRPKKHEVWE